MDSKEFVSTHPNKLHNLSKSKKATPARTENTSGRGFFSCHYHEFFNASPQNPQLTLEKRKTKREIMGYYVTPIREAHILVNCIIALDESILQML